MANITRTNTILLLGLADPENQAAWAEFDERYRPIILGFARRLGMHEAQAQDVAQETLLRVVQDFRAGSFDHGRGRLRSWLFTIARSRVFDARRLAARRQEARGDSALVDVPDDAVVSKCFDEEWQREVLRAAFAELRGATRTDPQTLRAFELLVVDERRAPEVAQELGMNVNAVYVAKHRTLERLRSILARLQDEF
ncbi:MAG: sigma-70 family RNA polymerase sigma factor [Planctomycetota bacterium]